MDVDYIVMLSILQLHRGKSIKLVQGKLCDVDGINDISSNDLLRYISEKFVLNMENKVLNESINRLISGGFLSIREGRMCPSLGLIHYFVEILQYGDDIKESLSMLSARMENKSK